MPPKNKTSLAISAELQAELDKRDDNFSGSVDRCLSRYFGLLARGRRELAAILSDNEVALILDTLNGTLMSDEHSAAFIPAEVSDAIRLNHLDEKWEVDGKALMIKLSGLNHWLLTALADASERWWIRVGEGENKLSPGEALK